MGIIAGRVPAEGGRSGRKVESGGGCAQVCRRTAEEVAARQASERAGLESTLKDLEQQLQSADERRTMLEEALMAAKARSTELADSHQAEISELQDRMAEVERKGAGCP